MGERSLYMYVLHIYLFWLICLQRNISQFCPVTRGWRPQFIHNKRQKNLTQARSFPAHLSERLMWAFLINICLLSDVVAVVKTFHLLLQNYGTDFNQTWHIASFNEDDSSLYELKVTYSFKNKDTSSLGKFKIKVKKKVVFFKNLLKTIRPKILKLVWGHPKLV